MGEEWEVSGRRVGDKWEEIGDKWETSGRRVGGDRR